MSDEVSCRSVHTYMQKIKIERERERTVRDTEEEHLTGEADGYRNNLRCGKISSNPKLGSLRKNPMC